ncbi:hypothetical protein C7293_29910, partial [filamentous cyanobacterium CCT1]
MTALYDQWQAARQLRQSEVVSRRDQVFTDLERWQADRLAHAVQLRQNLDQLMADLRTNTALWLTQTTADREAQILPRQQARQDYIQQLQADTEVLLAHYQADRKLSAAEVRQKLEHDCQVLQNTVSDLRLEIAQELRQVQQQVANIQAQTAVDRAGYRQEQAMVRAELLPQLTAYVEDLQVQVQATLKELTAVRQQAAVVNQAQRQSDRQALTESVDAMFDELADFRHQLQAQRAQLRATDEQVPQALSGWRPSAQAQGSYGYTDTETELNSGIKSRDDLRPLSGSVTLSQNVFAGGRTVNATDQAEASVLAGRETLESVEQNTLLNAVRAYMNVIRDQSTVELNQNNVEVLK